MADKIYQTEFEIFTYQTTNYVNYFLEGFKSDQDPRPSRIALKDIYTGIPANTITTAMIQNLAITTGKIADKAVTTDKLADGSVTTVKILNGAVTGDKIANHSINENHLVKNFDILSFIPDNSITSNKLKHTAGQEAVATNNIQVGAVTFDKLNANVFNYDNLASKGACCNVIAAVSVYSRKGMVDNNIVGAVIFSTKDVNLQDAVTDVTFKSISGYGGIGGTMFATTENRSAMTREREVWLLVPLQVPLNKTLYAYIVLASSDGNPDLEGLDTNTLFLGKSKSSMIITSRTIKGAGGGGRVAKITIGSFSSIPQSGSAYLGVRF